MPIDSDLKPILDKFNSFNAPPIEQLNPNAARNAPTLKNAVEDVAANSPAVRTLNVATLVLPEPVGKIEHVLIPGRGDILARVFKPADDSKQYPVLVYFHGGGWVIANLDVYEPSCRALCNAADCVVVSVAYRQAPEHPYPAAVEDAYDALQWIFQNAGQVNGDPTRIAVGGESAGGNLATVACLIAQEQGGNLPLAQLLVYPVTDMRGENYPSHAESTTAVPLKTAMLPWFFKHYISDEQARLEPYASPILANNLSRLPPAIVSQRSLTRCAMKARHMPTD